MDADTKETGISLLVSSTPAVILTDPNKAGELYAHIKSEIAAFVPDLTTATGRKAIGSLAFKISRTKTAIDDAGGEMAEALRTQVSALTKTRNTIKSELDKLRDLARKPLTDWEEADAKRVEDCNKVMADLKRAQVLPLGTTSEQAAERLATIVAVDLPAGTFRELHTAAETLKQQTVSILTAAVESLKQSEADARELEALRARKPVEVAKTTATDKASPAEAPSGTGDHPLLDDLSGLFRAAPTQALQQAQTVLAKEAESDHQATVQDRRVLVDQAVSGLMTAVGIDAGTARKIVFAILAKQIPNITMKV